MQKIKDIMEDLYIKQDPWGDLNSKYNETKFARQLKNIRKYQPKSVLEVGCGEGIFTRLMGNASYAVDAVDVSEKAIERAKVRCKDYKNIKFYCSDVVKFTLPKRYDMILLSEVMGYIIWLNNILDVGLWLTSLISSLNNGGKLVIVNTSEAKDLASGKDIVEYYPWARHSYFAILGDLGMKKISTKIYTGKKAGQARKYEIVIFSKNNEIQN